MFDLLDFVEESNRIERIKRAVTSEEVAAHETLLALPKITVPDLEAFVAVMQPDARLRTKAGMNVEVGPHTPPPGGPQVQIALEAMLEHDIKKDSLLAFNRHCRYETLHPFTDGNGRSGRAIWLWMMGGIDEAPLGFLHHFYYQSLQHFRA